MILNGYYLTIIIVNLYFCLSFINILNDHQFLSLAFNIIFSAHNLSQLAQNSHKTSIYIFFYV